MAEDDLVAFLRARFIETEVTVGARCYEIDPAWFDQLATDLDFKRRILDEVVSWPHDYIEGDTWFSCGMAVEPGQPDAEPGSGCANDDRAGQGCDCATGSRKDKLLGWLALPYAKHPDYRQEWAP